MPTDLEERVLTVEECAELLRISTRSAYAAIHRGEIPALTIGRRIVVPGASLRRLLASPTENFPLERSEVAEALSDEWTRGGE
jgi:excisionase family DNA binding protein